MTEEILNYLLSFASLILGTGWLFTWRANKKKANGEATQAEGEGWAVQQKVYRQTIEDMNGICERIREDRNHLREDRDLLRNENEALRKKYKEMEDKMDKMQSELERHERMIEALTPFLCGKPACLTREKVTLENNENDD